MKQTMLAATRFAMAFLLLSLSGYIAFAQEMPSRTLHKITYPNEPAEISNIRVEGKNILFGRDFSAGEDWLRGMTFDVRNASNKVITYIAVSILFQPGKSTKRGALHELSAGFNKTVYNPVDTKGKGIRLQPGGLLTLSVTEKDYLNISRLLTETGLNAETVKVSMIIHSVVFEDETKWSQGDTLTRDPRNPRSWIKVPTSKQTSHAAPRTRTTLNGVSLQLAESEAGSFLDMCYVPSGQLEYICGASLNDCSPLFCVKTVPRMRQDSEGVYFLNEFNSFCFDCEDDYCGSAIQQVGIPGCDPVLPLQNLPKIDQMARIKSSRS